LTKTAYRLGLKVKSADELAALQAGITKANADLAVALDKARAGNMDALDEMSTLATKGQFFREAYEAATDTKSAAGRFGWRKYFPEGKPAFAEATAPEGKFSPVTAAGKELIKEGYDFDIKGQLGARSAIVKKDGLVVGEITSSQKEPGTAFISLANVKKADRGHGVGEAAYRELLTQLKVDGVKEVTGMVVAPQPLAIREKIFGKGSTEIGDSERTVSVDDAMKELGDNALGFEVSNKITPESSFSAKRKSETEAQAKKRVEETDYSKYNVPVEHRPDTDTLTGWFTPDSKFVPIDTAYHQEWLAKNRAQLNKDFGTDFSSESSVEARLKATNAGFVRARDYGGTTHIELNQKFFKGATKAAIEDRVLNNADSIDKLQVTLLDDEGQVVDSTSAKLFDSEDPKAAAQAAIDSLKAVAAPVSGKGPSNIARMRALGGESFSVKKPSGESSLPGFAPEAATPHEKVVRAHVAGQKRAYPEALPVTHSRDESGNLKLGVGDKPITSKYDYELATSALAKKVAKGLKGQAREEAVTDAYAKGLEKLYADEAKNRPDIMDGVKWYSTARTCIKKLFGEDSKLFCELLGATSAQTPVDVNYRTAVDGYNLFKQGAYDKQIAQYRKGKATWDAGRIKEFIKATGNEKPNRSQFLDWWVEKYDLKPRKSNGTLFGANSRQVLRVLDGSWLEETQGPKTPNFAGNLAGTTFEATIDVWAARTLHRIGNEGLKDKWRILPESEQGVPDADFHLAQKAFRKAAAEIGIKPDALQAIVWFAEKDRWQRNGWTSTIGAEKSDFNVLLAESEKLPSGLIRKREPQLALSLNPGDIKSK
jgi:ribosomal protein S18 acetylase RimI-like enzyme